jgi:hypothetical protein
MAELRDYYRGKANQFFKASMVNNTDDENAMLDACKRCMMDNKIPMTDDEDEWLEFVYRAQEICELDEKGYYYHRVRKPNGDWDYVLEQRKSA